MLNSKTRTPLLRVYVNADVLGGVLEVHISSNSHYASDRFRVLAVLAAVDPALLALTQLQVEITAGIDAGYVSLITGNADRIDIDIVQGTVELEGRDLSSLLIGTRIQQAFSNQTSSAIMSTIAQSHDLLADVVATTTPVGRYYQSDHEQVALDQFSRCTTEWDLAVFLAQHEGFDLWVSGNSLHFRPSSGSAAPQGIAPSDCIDLRLERALTLAGDIEVIVKSWNTQQQVACTETATRAGNLPKKGQTQTYVYVRPNLVPAQAQQMAQHILGTLSQHERVVHATLPGNVVLSPRDFISLIGTGTDFDQVYQVVEVERELSVERGFIQRLRAKNSSVGNEPAVLAGAA